ncbi:hypothetical protein SNEBB_002367 [Seison nebaliae]|nr:hypothetical protein SNEBB_002367 [Seison nebaliae]
MLFVHSKWKIILVLIFVVLWTIIYLSIFGEFFNDLTYNSQVVKSGGIPVVLPESFQTIDDEIRDIDWFLHLSDIHISRYHGKERYDDMKQFLSRFLNIIDPSFVFVTGDLTDATEKNRKGSQQFLDEWQSYQTLWNLTNSFGYDWFDIRGNHDSFNVARYRDDQDLYLNFSSLKYLERTRKIKNPSNSFEMMRKRKDIRNSHSFLLQHQLNRFDKNNRKNLSIIALDSNPQPGPRRPFNFIGEFSEINWNWMKEMMEKVVNENSISLLAAHHPLNCLSLTDRNELLNLVKKYRKKDGRILSGYLTGHLHNFFNVGGRMFRRHIDNLYEFELNDWKYSRALRLFAVDSDSFTFHDYRFNNGKSEVKKSVKKLKNFDGTSQLIGENSTIFLITNPSLWRHQQNNEKWLNYVLKTNYIHLLLFNQKSFNGITVEIFHKGKLIETLKKIDRKFKPLYLIKWQPKSLLKLCSEFECLFELKLKIHEENNDLVSSHSFSLGTNWNDRLPRLDKISLFILTFPQSIFQVIYYNSICVVILFFIYCRWISGKKLLSCKRPRLCDVPLKYCPKHPKFFYSTFIDALIRGTYILSYSYIDMIYLFIYIIWIAALPWFMVDITINEHHRDTSFFFAYGIYSTKSSVMLAPGIQYIYATFMMIIYLIPMLITMALDANFYFEEGNRGFNVLHRPSMTELVRENQIEINEVSTDDQLNENDVQPSIVTCKGKLCELCRRTFFYFFYYQIYFIIFISLVIIPLCISYSFRLFIFSPVLFWLPLIGSILRLTLTRRLASKRIISNL